MSTFEQLLALHLNIKPFMGERHESDTTQRLPRQRREAHVPSARPTKCPSRRAEKGKKKIERVVGPYILRMKDEKMPSQPSVGMRIHFLSLQLKKAHRSGDDDSRFSFHRPSQHRYSLSLSQLQILKLKIPYFTSKEFRLSTVLNYSVQFLTIFDDFLSILTKMQLNWEPNLQFFFWYLCFNCL